MSDGTYIWPTLKINPSTVQSYGTAIYTLSNQGAYIAFANPSLESDASAMPSYMATEDAAMDLIVEGLPLMLQDYNAGQTSEWGSTDFFSGWAFVLQQNNIDIGLVRCSNIWDLGDTINSLSPFNVPSSVITPII